MRALGWGSRAQGGQQPVVKQQQAEEAHEDQQHQQHDIRSEGRQLSEISNTVKTKAEAMLKYVTATQENI